MDSDEDYRGAMSDDEDIGRGGSGSYGTRANGRRRAANGQPARNKAAWEGAIRRDFGSLREGPDGLITRNLVEEMEARKRKRLRQDTKSFQRGIIRHVTLVLDMSEAMLEKDMRPTRYIVMINAAKDYIREFFEENPISQMAILGMHDGLCIRISELSGNPSDHINALQELRQPRDLKNLKEPKGNPSLQNALEQARAGLYHTPSHGTREVIIILGALLSLDPGDIHATIKSCIRDHIRVSIIGMGGRLRICQEICSRTNGGDDSSYTVALDQTHFRELLMATTTPPVIRAARTADAAPENPASLLMMGFPSRTVDDHPSFCACHNTLSRDGYICPRCKVKVCMLPANCPACNLTLILSTHLARSYHHLFPLSNFAEVSWQRARELGSVQCKACLSDFPPVPVEIPSAKDKGKGKAAAGADSQTQRRTRAPLAVGVDPTVAGGAVKPATGAGASESSRYECTACHSHFCVDCDLHLHEVVHNCPGCLEGLSAAAVDGDGGQAERMELDAPVAGVA